MKIYLAAPLFSEAEQNWLRSLKGERQALGYDVYSGLMSFSTRLESPHEAMQLQKE